MKHSILYLDDNESLTAAVGEYLSRWGYEVDCAHTVDQAKTHFARKTYSMVLVDLRLSGMSLEGFEFACRLQEQSPWTPLMLFTACMSPEVQMQTIQRRMRIISKPKPLPELKTIIGAYLQEKYPLTPANLGSV